MPDTAPNPEPPQGKAGPLPSRTGTVRPIYMPAIGEDAEKALLTRWIASKGDRVKPGDVLFEIETDKAVLEVESEWEGFLRRIVAQEGEKLPAGAVVAYLADSEEELAAFLDSADRSLSSAPCPNVPSGAVLKPMTPMRRAIARNMIASAQQIPQFYMKLTIEAGSLMEVYKRQKRISRASLNDLLVAAVGRVLMDFPAFRSQVYGEELLEFENANVGIVVAAGDALRVAVVTSVEKRSLAELAAETRRVISEAREGRLPNAGKSAVTISNLGMTEIEEFTAIVHPPEAAILAVGRMREDVKVEKGELRATLRMTMWLSSNHRVVDGLMASRFLSALRKILEKPEVLEEQ